mmetsp:Transcript_38148/g.85174  ORF Transcript_38148/g.85174 Transcript_38148/m.85174 type:complete len:280 (+) Transcript_38148:57-896(+)|eukprot:CAMPEP_0172616072 /NCGR_PEP_ID=MMETSP1068-20121228/62693_1 /TAXON_ID=35684 /ORGANISM="Pseudopedinella elastica, Strain CCMP716" /LENGTH=279 /DNA_ID=CAMNT_0013421399 /DNA_START=45 /DNA_END=884 /DNA_ORIENTATION=-
MQNEKEFPAPSLTDRLHELSEARLSGQLTEQEFHDAKQRVLAEYSGRGGVNAQTTQPQQAAAPQQAAPQQNVPVVHATVVGVVQPNQQNYNQPYQVGLNHNYRVVQVAPAIHGQVSGGGYPPQAGPGGGLLPYPDKAHWNSDEMEKCCTCTGECWVAWCCPCVTAGQIASKLSKVGSSYFCLGYQGIVGIYILLAILDFILEVAAGVDLNPHYIFMFFVTMQLRKRVRDTLRINGDCCNDCICSCFCGPCVLTQMVHTLWARPAEVPACNLSEAPAGMP